MKHSYTITSLRLYINYEHALPFLFVNSFTNLQKFILTSGYEVVVDFANCSKLEILKIPYKFPKSEYVIKFLENNGKNLKKLYIKQNNKALSLSIANFCPKLQVFL
jgi:hypothetical protein